MAFMSDLHSRLLETKKFVNILKTQLDQLTTGNYTYMTNQGTNDDNVNNWTINCTRLIATLKEIQKHLLDRCLMTNGRFTVHGTQLDSIQDLCEILGNIWLNLRTQLMVTYQYSGSGDHLNLREEIETLLCQLIKRTFIVVQQPPQVVKTNSRFPAIVRFLTGALFTSSNLEFTKVYASILNESQARTAMTQTSGSSSMSFNLTCNTSGAIINREAVLLHTPTDQFVANFQGIVLKKISRTEKKGQVSVMDEKFAISFQSEVKCADGQLVFYVQTLSLPLVVIVHGNQEINAWATVTWDNTFASPSRLPFVVPEKVPWVNVGQMLSHKFAASVGCYLNQNDLRFLATKAFRDSTLTEYDSMYLSWSQFAKESLPNATFTFWEWFYSIIKLTREHLKDLWTSTNRLIYGFISRQDCEYELNGKPDGTFLLRFSETALGCLSIAYTVTNRLNQKVVLNLAPFSLRDLTIRSIPDRINDIKHLRYLCPNIPKDEAFGPFYGPTEVIEPSPMGYVKSVLVTQVPGWTPDQFDYFPKTPQPNLFLTNQAPSSNNQFYQSPVSATEISASNDNQSSSQSPENFFSDNDLDQMMQDVGLNLDGFQVDSLNVKLSDIFANVDNYNFNNFD